MRHIQPICLFVFMLLLSSHSVAQQDSHSESILTLANQMIATESRSNSSSPESVESAVLLIHGWAGQMDEVGDIYKRLATELANQGIASLRINIRGESEREATGYRLTSTFASRVEDAETGMDFLMNKYPNARLGLVGFSLGGATAMKLIGDNPEKIQSLVLWSSVGNPDILFQDFDENQRREVLENGEAVLPMWVDLRVTRQHYLGFENYDIFTPLRAYQGALLSIRGTEDYVPPQEAQILAAASAAPEEVWQVPGADHVFNVFELPNPGYDEQVIQRTTSFLVETLSTE